MATPDELHRSHTGGSTDASQGRAGDDHSGPAVVVDQAIIAVGHEPDEVSVKGILIVPAIIVVGFIIAFVTVTILIKVYRAPDTSSRASANPLALKKADETLERKFENITSSREQGGDDQPRLEGLRQVGPGTESDPLWMRTRLPSGPGNSPEYHPEQLRPDQVPHLWSDHEGYGWVDGKKFAHIPIWRAIELAAKNKSVLPTRPDPIPGDIRSAPGRPKQTNSGRGILGTAAANVASPETTGAKDTPKNKEEAKDEPKGKEPAKSEGKKDEGKKEASKTDEKSPQPKEQGGTEGKK